VLYVLGWAFDKYIDNVLSETVLPWLGNATRALASQPLSVVGLFVVCWLCVWFAVVLVMGMVETKPKLGIATVTLPPPVSALDMAEIERIRELWLDEPEQACERAERLLHDFRERQVQKGNPIAILLGRPGKELRESAQRLRALLNADNVQLFDVQLALRETIDHYATVVGLINLCLLHEAEVRPTMQGDLTELTRLHMKVSENMNMLRRRRNLENLGIGIREHLADIRFDDPFLSEYVSRAKS
jgi:hypothetical protein